MKFKPSYYVLQMALCFAGYAIGLIALRRCEYAHLAIPRYVQFLLPMLPMLCMVVVIFRAVSLMDEMWRKLIMEGMAFAGLATAFTCMSFTFIQDLGGAVRPFWGFNAFWTYYLLWTAWSRWRLR